jgi:hypothetical protein
MRGTTRRLVMVAVVVVMALAIAATLTGRTVSSWTRGRNECGNRLFTIPIDEFGTISRHHEQEYALKLADKSRVKQRWIHAMVCGSMSKRQTAKLRGLLRGDCASQNAPKHYRHLRLKAFFIMREGLGLPYRQAPLS